MSKNSHLIPDIIRDLLTKMINATSANERHNYELQVQAIRDACTIALTKSATSTIKPKLKASRRHSNHTVIDYRQIGE